MAQASGPAGLGLKGGWRTQVMVGGWGPSVGGRGHGRGVGKKNIIITIIILFGGRREVVRVMLYTCLSDVALRSFLTLQATQ